MKKTIVPLCLVALLFSGCDIFDELERYYDTHIIIEEKAEMSVIPGVFAERSSNENIVLEFDEEVDSDILDLLRLTDYTEAVPDELPESLPGVRFYVDPDDDEQVIVDVSSIDCSNPRPVTLIYDNGKEPVLAHMMLVQDSSDEKILAGEKSYSAVISDIHLNDARSKIYGWSWFNRNQDALIAYIDRLIEDKEHYRELILLGDVMDAYVTPVPFATFAKPDGTVVTEKEYFRLIANANEAVIDKFRELQEAGIKLIYVPGNHDCAIDAADVSELFGPDAVFVSDVRGLGTYVPEYASEIAMEHSHRYDITCAPDMLSNIGTDSVTEENAFMGAQYFVTRIAATHDYLAKKKDDNKGIVSLKDFGISEDQVLSAANGNQLHSAVRGGGSPSGGSDEFNLFVMKTYWNVIALAKNFPGFSTTAIPTGVNGLTKGYVASQYSYLGENPQPELYKSMYLQSEWQKRLELNNAPSGFPFLLGAVLCEVPNMDTHAVSWIAERDRSHRIFIWGHTHNPLMMAERFDGSSRGYIYANTGAWVDDDVSRYDTRSFVSLYYGMDGYIQVCVRQMGEDGSVRDLYNPLWLKR